MKPISICSVLLIVSLAVAWGGTAWALEGGAASLKIGDQVVVKNGTGTRQKMLLSLYDSTLYLKQHSQNARAIVAADEEMAVRIKITSRFVSQEKMVTALDEGFRTSTGGNTASIAADIEKFKSCFSDPISMNDEFILAYSPGSGVTVYKNNAKKGVVGDLAFKKALMGIWLGDNPIDTALKNAMLGK